MRLAAAAAGGTLALALAGPALAQDPIVINPGNVPTTAAGFGEQDCTGPFADLPDNVDGWHFVTGAAGINFTELALRFDTPDGEVLVSIDSTDPESPSTNADPFWSGFIGEPHNGHAWVMTEAGWTLIDGEATVDEAGQQEQFQLSHTCPGEPGNGKTPTPTPEPSEEPTPGPSEEPTPAPSEEPTPAPSEEPKKPGLPVTGVGIGGMLVFGGGLLAAGIAMLAVRRRRNLSDVLEG
jgi:hypothetical protein